MPPKAVPNAKFRESVLMGYYTGAALQLDTIIHKLRQQFGPSDYELLTKNCNSFSEAFVYMLLNTKIPAYVNRMATWGSIFSCCLDMNQLTQPPPAQIENSAYNPLNHGMPVVNVSLFIVIKVDYIV